MLDAGIAPGDGWVKELKRADGLLRRIKAKLSQLEEWLTEIEKPFGEQDGVYRFYHQSYKVFERLNHRPKEAFS